MRESELQAYLLAHYPKENERCDWKAYNSLKNTFASHICDDVISYVSGFANREGGCLVIGFEDGTGRIRGIQDLAGHTLEAMPQRIVTKCVDANTVGLCVYELIIIDTGQRVWLIPVPKHLPRRPVVAHRQKWQRLGDSLVSLTKEREDAILAEPLRQTDDWSRVTCAEATLRDLERVRHSCTVWASGLNARTH